MRTRSLGDGLPKRSRSEVAAGFALSKPPEFCKGALTGAVRLGGRPCEGKFRGAAAD